MIVNLQASTKLPLRLVVEEVIQAVTRVFGGIDSASFLGSKALVIRAEILPNKIDLLVSELESHDLKVAGVEAGRMGADFISDECPITIKVTSCSRDTDGRQIIPSVPG